MPNQQFSATHVPSPSVFATYFNWWSFATYKIQNEHGLKIKLKIYWTNWGIFSAIPWLDANDSATCTGIWGPNCSTKCCWVTRTDCRVLATFLEKIKLFKAPKLMFTSFLALSTVTGRANYSRSWKHIYILGVDALLVADRKKDEVPEALWFKLSISKKKKMKITKITDKANLILTKVEITILRSLE